MDIHSSRKNFIDSQSTQSYFVNLQKNISLAYSSSKTIFPTQDNVYKAYELTNLENIKVVILWQDPYHGPWQAHGLAFSVPEWITLPPSLRNIYKELDDDLWEVVSNRGDLTERAKQWVFLLNSFLTVEEGQAWSHKDLGWEQFTDATIKYISDNKTWIVFLLWWNYARSKKKLIDQDIHLILETSHPSPLSSYRGFLWSKHFSKTNTFLSEQGKEMIQR